MVMEKKKTIAVIKGQIKLKADWRAVDSPKKRMDEFDLFAVQIKFVSLFFGRVYGAPICFRN